MGICINYMVRKQKGEPNTAVICTSMKEFQKAVEHNGYIRSENERFYGENETHKVDFSKTSGPRTERGQFLNDHINLCDELEELNAKGYLEVI